MRTVWYVGQDVCTKDYNVAVAGGFNQNVRLVERDMRTAAEKKAMAERARKIAEKFGIK